MKPYKKTSPEIMDIIVEQLAQGMSLRAICSPDDMPDRNTVMRWWDADPEYAAKCARARDVGFDDQAEKLAEDIESDPDVARARLKFDYRKWYLSKLRPKVYGDKVDLTHSGPNGGPIQTEEVSAKDVIASRLARLSAGNTTTGDAGEPE